LSPGPIIFQADEGDKSNRFATHVADLLFSHKRMVRDIALKHFESLVVSGGQLLTRQTKKIITKYCDDLRSNNAIKWRTAAVCISDTIHDDFFCNMAGVNQSIEARYDQGIDKYLPLILRPQKSTLNLLGLELPITNPSNNRPKIESIIKKCTKKPKSLYEACNFYYQELGHLALDTPISLSRVVSDWINQNGKSKKIWGEVWEWANQISSPLPRYHSCIVFTQRPDLVPAGKMGTLWNEILNIIQLPKKERLSPQWSKEWEMRCGLAKHYSKHFECLYPGGDGESIANTAWWLSEQVSLLFDKASKNIANFYEKTILPEINLSSYIWQMTCPFIKPSVFSYATNFIDSLWSLSLQVGIGKNLAALNKWKMDSEKKEHLVFALTGSIIGGSPLLANDSKQPTFIFEHSVISTAKAWSKVNSGEKNSKILRDLVDEYLRISKPENFAETFKEIAKKDELNQTAIAHMLELMGIINTAPVDLVWDCISDLEWRKKTLQHLHPRALMIIFHALTMIQIYNGKKWASDLPHFFASTCEELSSNRNQQNLWFNLTILSSISSDTVSAIERLLQGSHRKEFVEDVVFWRQQIEEIQNISPEWISSKMRAFMASLYVD
jgi:hypothetical protein